MFRNRQNAIILLVSISFLLAACSNGAAVVGVEQSGEGSVGPQEIENATEIVKFDPASIALGDGEPVPGACVESSIVAGTYRCDLEAGDAAEPCFALGGTRLICGPNPVTGTYTTLVSPTNTLPSVAPPPPDRAAMFFVELDTGMTCAIHTGIEPVIVGGVAGQYDCNTPYTYIIDVENTAPTWEAIVLTLDPATGESPAGRTPTGVRRVWIP